MRFHLPVIGLIALFIAAPALADVTLRYAPGPGGGPRLTIEADDAGRVRAEGANGQVMIIRDGEIYLIPPRPDRAPDGVVVVGRLEDFAAVTMEMLQRLMGEGALFPASSGYTLDERGTETVGSWQGAVYAIAPDGVDETSGPAGRALELVVSEDPALAAGRRPSQQVFGALVRMIGMAFGGDPPALIAQAAGVLARGTALRLDREFQLESIAEGPVPPARFDLPGPVLSREALRAQLTAAMAARQDAGQE